MNIKSKDLSKIGYTNDQTRSLVLNIISKHFKHHTKSEIITLLNEVKNAPEIFLNDPILGKIADTFVEKVVVKNYQTYALNPEPAPAQIFGNQHIDGAAKQQMKVALQLPVAIGGALMPDAHVGYGLPIGGVLATDNAIIPYAVGVDIGCRMALSIFDVSENDLNRYQYQCTTALHEWTHFGLEGSLEKKVRHDIIDHPHFDLIPLAKELKSKAARQLGSSGSGNHFVEWGVIELLENNILGIKAGKYTALLSHSGSRGLGAALAMHYSKIAMDKCKLPADAKKLAWLDLNSQEGQEYWIAMNLAGEYARACHDIKNKNLSEALGFQTLIKVENHHNFAWKELINGKELIVHRKGATPAKQGELGIIPGSMIHTGYLVSGKGNEGALQSASHGAGRAQSRIKAKNSNTNSEMKKLLSQHGVTLIGGSTEESPSAYKNIDAIMASQTDLVKVEGKFFPKIVRMNKE